MAIPFLASFFLAISYLQDAEWLWELERRQYALWGTELKRADWERWRRFKGIFAIAAPTIFLIFLWLVLFVWN
jgi:hypothetical protein